MSILIDEIKGDDGMSVKVYEDELVFSFDKNMCPEHVKVDCTCDEPDQDGK